MAAEFPYGRLQDAYLNVKEAAKEPWRGVTAWVQGSPYLVVNKDGESFILEGENGEKVTLKSFEKWEPATEESALVAASRLEGSPFAKGEKVGTFTVGDLVYFQKEWSARVGDTGIVLPLDRLVARYDKFRWDKNADMYPQVDYRCPNCGSNNVGPTGEYEGDNADWVCTDCGTYGNEHDFMDEEPDRNMGDAGFYEDWNPMSKTKTAESMTSFDYQLPPFGLHNRTHDAMHKAGLAARVHYPPGVTMDYPEGFTSDIPSGSAMDDAWITSDLENPEDVWVKVETPHDPNAVREILDRLGGRRMARTAEREEGLKCPNCGSHTIRAFTPEADQAHMVCLTCGKEFDRDVVKNPESSIKKSYMPIDQGLQQQILGLQQQIQQAYKEGNQQRAMQLNQQLAKLLENPNAPVQNMIGLASKDCTCEGDCQCGDDCSCGKEAMVKEAPGKEHMKGVSPKRNRQYEDILASCRKSHPDWTEDRCKELAARTVNKTRSEKGETKSSIDKEGFDPSPLIPLSPLLGIIGSLAARIIATEVRLHKERKVDKQQLEDRIREYLTSQGHAPEEVEQAIQQADQQGIIDPSGLTMDIPRNIQRRYLNGSIEPIDTIDKFFVDSPEFADNIYEGARSDYDHWNEDADRMWWEEEGKHPHEPEYDPDDYLHGGGGAEEAAIDELYEDFRDMEDADLEEIIAGTYAGYLPYAEHLDPSTFKEIAQEVLAERRPQQPQFVYQSRSTQSWYDGADDPYPPGPQQVDLNEYQQDEPALMDDGPDYDYAHCPGCDGPGVMLGQLGNRMHYRCRNCGMDFSHKMEDSSSGDASGTIPPPPEAPPGQGPMPQQDEGFYGYSNIEDVKQINQDSLRAFKDSGGNPLEAGKFYLLRHPEHKVPDVVKILNLEDNRIEAAIASDEHGAFPIHITHDDVYTLDPYKESKWKVAAGYYDNSPDTRALYDRGDEMLGPVPPSCPVCGGEGIESLDRPGYRCTTCGAEYNDQGGIGFAGYGPDSGHRYRAKVAARDFSAQEQRELIEENPEGRARNFDKLNLDGTHYNLKEESTDPYFLLGL